MAQFLVESVVVPIVGADVCPALRASRLTPVDAIRAV
jgi:ABC-type lipoprotein release transport system permease subunit